MNDEERITTVEEILNEISDSDCVIVVEGNKDTRSLRSLDVENTIFEVNACGGPLKTAEMISELGKKAIILTDWDKKGDDIAGRLAEQFKSLCIEFDLSFRGKLRAVCSKDIKDVESLNTFYRRLKDDN